ncbi:hypothetical protein PU629_03980 [Pullulanibacillus sp. KACC 23026]|uniref:hypothetical protein n=1 Tax=Pullulanibacillus sp. KACC 23026 TaxID=3028315 RepID=UPI0023B16EB4|nr:hypothetical protein [Pullulanibacillus sp. KACC 23026]WEG13534.1 hypothetical protein PU629_03980 [Pullulanibacillus sp. KACC 23026]
MLSHSFRFILIVMSVVFLLFGCSNNLNSKSNLVKKSSHLYQKQTNNIESKQDGELISLKKINIQQIYDLQSYRMTYWSDGVKTVAYVAAPKEINVGLSKTL